MNLATASKATLPVLASASRVDIDGSSFAFMLFTDISERKKAEDALRASQERLGAINATLDRRVAERTQELQAQREELFAVNRKLIATSAEAKAEAQRFSALAALAAWVPHEIAQPLTSIKLAADSAIIWHSEGQAASADDNITDMKAISRQVDRIDRIMQHLRALVHKQRLEIAPCDLNAAVNAALGELQAGPSAREIAWNSFFDGNLPPVLGNAESIGEVVTNLAANAIKALSKTDRPEKAITVRTIRAGDSAELEISDNGPGIDEAIREKIFETFFTTDATGVGMGLGLSIVKAIVAAHNGRIEVFPNQPQGTTFRVTIPLADSASDSSEAG